MQELIARIASSAGISEDLAQTGVKIIINFLNKEAPDDKMNLLMEALPGLSDLLDGGESSGGGLLGGLMGGLGGAMAAMNELNSAGLGMGEVKSVAGELVAAAKENLDDESVIDDIIGSVPGLSQIL